MNQRSDTVSPETTADEQRTVEYLLKHPDFFEKHPQLLAQLALPREDGEGTISLQERQVQQMRKQEMDTRRQLEKFIDTARENSELEQRIQMLALELLALNGGGDALTQAVHLVQEKFGIDYIRLHLADDDAETYAELAPRVKHLSSVCDDRLPSKLLCALFNQPQEKVRSCALIPLAHDKILHGVLALGSRAPDRFHPNLGAMYLDRLGAMLGALACR